jgi:hypothetical protein
MTSGFSSHAKERDAGSSPDGLLARRDCEPWTLAATRTKPGRNSRALNAHCSEDPARPIKDLKLVTSGCSSFDLNCDPRRANVTFWRMALRCLGR